MTTKTMWLMKCTKLFFASLILAIVAGCSSMRTTEDVGTAVVSASSGLSWHSDATNGFVINIRDYNGINRELSWSPDILADTASLQKMRYCLEQALQRLRLSEHDIVVEQPDFLRMVVAKCIEYAPIGSPYKEIRLEDADEYDLWINAGNANNHMPTEQGTRIAAAGGPFLGSRLRIKRLTEEPELAAKAAADSKECVNVAARKGVFDSTTLTSTQGGWESSHSWTSIEPFVDRLSDCLRHRSYRVENVSKRTG